MADATKRAGGRGRSNAPPQQAPRRPGDNPPISQGIGRGAVRTAPQVTTAGPVGTAPAAIQTPGNVAGATAIEVQRAPDREANRHVVTRPSPTFVKTGSGGAPLDVRSNYFQLIKKPDMHLLQYRVDFTPEIDHPGVKKALIRVHERTLGKYVFDGTLLYNTTRLAQPLELASRRTSDETDVKITLDFKNEIQAGDPVYNSVMNLILRRCLANLNMVMIRRDYYDAAAREDVPGHPITIWPGYLTAINHHEKDCLLNVEIVHKFLRRDSALDIMDRIRRSGSDGIKERITAELVGKIVMTGYNNKTYRIDDVDFTQSASSTFHLRKEDRDISYINYYKERYQQTIKSVTQPLLVSKPTRRDINRGNNENVYLVPELCGMTGLSQEQRANFNLTRAISTITRVAPDRRVETLMKFRRRLAETPQIQQELNSWGIQFANDIVNCQARILPTKSILTGGKKIDVRDGDWSRSMHNTKMQVSVRLDHWLVIHPNSMGQQVRSFVQLIKRVGGPQGFNVPEPDYISLEADRTTNYANALKNELPKKPYDIVMCVLRTGREDIYSVIKNITFCQVGIASQVITGRILQGDERKQLSVATKVMTQIACKLGAEPWRVDVPNKPWMICGYDTYHDATQKRAVGAFVASVNPCYTRYNSSVKIHSANEEISPSFQDHMITSLRAYYLANRTLPEKIIIYRDGVGAGDIVRLMETEVTAVKSACTEAGNRVLSGKYTPGIAFVVVSKRINTRFFAGRKEKPENPPCGTVVDNTVTLTDRFDFFLVSQKVNQGTVSPTNFNIIFNSANFTPEIHQSMAYSLTQVYYNWPGTLRVPAPVQYAHKLAYLVGESIRNLPRPELAKFPYYL
ncbi:piwi-like protein Siwi [Daphnia pulex]|uniref:piwi-like protein Siwi n=1 Tax=Daphnia pulex TaxID=6669 RepID=UPI001EE0E9CA|nr:piwi-like protein Siwi [Daphnia pulex]